MSASIEFNRRHLLQSAGALAGVCALGGCATNATSSLVYNPVLQPIRARMDRVFDITVCLRPFRAMGPRLDTEEIGRAFIVHNYGHGGSGWSLSWGSGTMAVKKAMSKSPKEIAVIGCGAIGLTSAILAQQAGAKVTIYAQEPISRTRSVRATGSWTPDSRIALADKVAPDFPALWEEMARISWKTYRSYLGLPGEPVEWIDQYVVRDDGPQAASSAPADALDFASYGDRIADLTPNRHMLPKGSTQFEAPFVARNETLMFNIADYAHTLMSDFYAAGGKFEYREFHEPKEIAQLKEKVVINCPGYGARALWKDETITPVRGQIQWLIPQPEVRYAVFYKGVNVLARRDGICVQGLEGGDMRGVGNTDETPDRAEAQTEVAKVAELYTHFRPIGNV